MGMKEFGELIRSTRERRKLRAFDLSYAIGQNPSWLSRVESGSLTHPPAPSVIDSLSAELGLPVAEMMEALGYQVRVKPTGIAEEAPAYDDTAAALARATSDWSPRQKQLLWQYIESVSAALDERDRRDESGPAERGA